jgi:RNA polymerase sigma factor (sigma-70 family)
MELETIVRKTRPTLIRMAMRLVNNPHDAEDVTQAFLLRAACHQFDSERHFLRVAVVALRRECINLWRTRKKTFDMSIEDALNRDEEETTRTYLKQDIFLRAGVIVASPERVVLDETVSDELMELLGQLKPHWREAILLTVECDSNAECAQIAGCSVVAFRHRLFRARKEALALMAGRAAA